MLRMLDTPRLRSLISSKAITQKELAMASGVSRAQLARILGSRDSTVRNATLDGIARAVGVDPDDIVVGGAISGYNRWVGEEHGWIDFRGMGMPSLQRQAIGCVFVDVDVVGQPCGEADNACPAPPMFAARKANVQPPMPGTECVASQDRIVLAGNPGSGKTTLLRYVAWQTATAGDSKETPIYLRLPELCRAKQLDARVDVVDLSPHARWPPAAATLRRPFDRNWRTTGGTAWCCWMGWMRSAAWKSGGFSSRAYRHSSSDTLGTGSW